FRDSFEGAVTALFYYSGHALRYDDDTYLIPVDARIEVQEDLAQLAFQVQPRLTLMRSSVPLSLVFLDACRDRPFTLRRTKKVVIEQPRLKTRLPEAGLNDVFVAYAADPGETAVDGEEGDASPFTKALLDHIKKPGVEIRDMMDQVTAAVRSAT